MINCTDCWCLNDKWCRLYEVSNAVWKPGATSGPWDETQSLACGFPGLSAVLGRDRTVDLECLGVKNGGSRPTTDVVTYMSLWWHRTRNEKRRVRENCSQILEADSATAKVYWVIRRRRSTETIIVTILITVSFVPINYHGALLPIHRSNKALRKSQHNVLNKTGIADDVCKYEILVLDGRIFRLAALLGWTALDRDELISTLPPDGATLSRLICGLSNTLISKSL